MVWVELVKMPVDHSEEFPADFCFHRAAKRRIEIYRLLAPASVFSFGVVICCGVFQLRALIPTPSEFFFIVDLCGIKDLFVPG